MNHLAFIRSLPCCRCGKSPSQAAHVRMGTGGGMGMKPDDRYTVPLCADCHRRQHDVGERAFWGDDPVHFLAGYLWESAGGKDASENRRMAIAAVLRFRLRSKGVVA